VFCTGVRNDEELDFLTSNTVTENGRRIDRKLNVAITRARKQFVLIGNGQLLMRNELYKSLILLIQQ
jgi:superfamily I DNA and/or RNA helicase